MTQSIHGKRISVYADFCPQHIGVNDVLLIVSEGTKQLRDNDVCTIVVFRMPVAHVRGDDLDAVAPELFLFGQQRDDGVRVLLDGEDAHATVGFDASLQTGSHQRTWNVGWSLIN